MVPRLDDAMEAELARLALRLCAVLPWHDALWRQAADEGWLADARPAPAREERSALATGIDDLVGRAFGLSAADVAWIVRGCDVVGDAPFGRRSAAAHSKGFWRVDRTLPPGERRPMRWLAAAASP